MTPEKFFDYLEGKLPPAERERLERALIADPELQQQFHHARQIHRGLQNDPRQSSATTRSGHRGRQLAAAFAVLVAMNVALGLIYIFKVNKPDPQVQQARQEALRHQLQSSVEKQAAAAFTPPVIGMEQIALPAPRPQQEAIAQQIIATASAAGGSGTKGLPNDKGFSVLVVIPGRAAAGFRETLTSLGAAAPVNASPGPHAGRPRPAGSRADQPAVIAITFALPHESRDFLRVVGNKRARVAVLHTGVGAAICRQRIGPFLDAQPFEFLISSGFAGGVDPSLGAGHLLLAENFSDPALRQRAESILVARTARLASTDHILDGAAERSAFAATHQAAAVDMETATIAAACAARNLPMISLRAISDTTAAPFPAPPEILFDLARQRTNAFRLGRHLLRHPATIVRLLRFSRQIEVARADLAAALCEFLAVA